MAIDLTSNCLAWFKLNDDGASTTVTNEQDIDGVASANTSVFANASGKINGCFEFDRAGTNTHVNVDNCFTFPLSAGSLCCWVRVDSDVDYSQYIFCGYDTSTNRHFWLYIDDEYVAEERLKLIIGSSGVGAQIAVLATETWYFVCLTWNGTTWDAWVNDTKEIDATAYADLDAALNKKTIGSADAGVGVSSDYTLDGGIDNLMVFDKVLSDDEIAWLYNSGDGREAIAETTTVIDRLTLLRNRNRLIANQRRGF